MPKGIIKITGGISGTSLILMVGATLALYLIMEVLEIYLTYSSVFEWWYSKENNPHGVYGSQFNIWHTLAFFHGSSLLYMIHGLFLSESQQLSPGGTQFVANALFPYMTFTMDGRQQNIMTPRQLTKTLQLTSQDGDAPYDAWWLSNRRYFFENLPDSPSGPSYLTFTKQQKTGGPFDKGGTDKGTWWDFIPQTITAPGTPAHGKFGIYPEFQKVLDWQGVLQLWANGWAVQGGVSTWPKVNGYKWFYWYKNEAGPSPQWSLQATPGVNGTLDHWFGSARNPANFLGRYAIPPNADFVQAFIQGTASYGGVNIDPSAFQNLINPNAVSGGWLGLIRGAGDISFDDLNTLVFKDAEIDRIVKNPVCAERSSGHRIAGGFMGFISSFLPMLAMAVMVFATGGAAAPAAIAEGAAEEAGAASAAKVAAGGIGLCGVGMGALGAVKGAAGTSTCSCAARSCNDSE